MQPINEIFKEIGLFVWLLWGVSITAMGMAVVSALKRKRDTEFKSWLSMLPLPGITFLFVMIGMMLYFANDSIKRRKAWDQDRARLDGELAAIKAIPVLEEKKTVTLDRRLQSVNGIIGYLDQSIKMGQEPKDLTPILLFLAKEIKDIRDEK